MFVYHRATQTPAYSSLSASEKSRVFAQSFPEMTHKTLSSYTIESTKSNTACYRLVLKQHPFVRNVKNNEYMMRNVKDANLTQVVGS